MKRLISFLLVCILFCASIPLCAAEDYEPAVLYGQDASCYASYSLTMYIYASGLDNVAALDFYVYYDSSVVSVSNAQLGGLMSGTLSDVNITANSVNFSIVSMTPISGSGFIASLSINVAASAEPGEYQFDLAVGDAYDPSLQPLTVSGGSYKLTVMEQQIITPTQSIYPYSNSGGSYTAGDEFNVTFYSSYVENLGAMDIVTEYDNTLITLTGVTLGEALTSSSQALWSINTDIPGFVKCSYIAPFGVSGYFSPLITYSFEVVSNVDDSAIITLALQNVCDIDRNAINASSAAATVSIYKTVEEPVLPAIELRTESETLDTVTYTVFVPGETNLAAGDFTLLFDNARLQCSSISGTGQGLVVSNIKNEQGKATFSFLLDGGITADAEIGRIVFEKINDLHAETAVDLTGRALVNDALAPVEVTFSGGTATTHYYQFSCWEWAEDDRTASAVFICSGEPDQPLRIEAQMSVVKGASTYFEPGISTYTASVTFYGQTYTDSRTVEETTAFNHSCTFANDLTLNYYLRRDLLQGYTNIYLVVEKDCYDANGDLMPEREEVTLQGSNATLSGTAYYKFKYKGVASYELCDGLYAYLHATKNGVEYVSPVDAYTIKTYAYNRLEKSTDAVFKTLLVDLLNYCSQSQIYFDYRTDTLANAELTDAQRALASESFAQLVDTSSEVPVEGATVTFYGKSVVFDSNTEVKVYVTLNGFSGDRSNLKMRFEYDGVYGHNVVEIPYSEFGYDTGYRAHFAKLKEIAMYDARAPITITVLDGTTQVSNTLTYSIETYAYNRLLKSTDEMFKELIRMTMKYADSARLYFELTG